MKKGILATAMMAAALTMGFSSERAMIKRDNTISRNWKEDQDKKDKLRKAELKRERKRKLKEEQMWRCKNGS